MRLPKYVQSLVTFLFGCFTVYFMQKIPLKNTKLQELPVREIFQKTPDISKHTVPTAVHKTTTNTVYDTDNFTRMYVKSVFCNKKMSKRVPSKISEPLIVPDERFTVGHELVVLVISSHDHTDFRKAIRRTWANNTLGVVAVIFVFGRHWDENWNTFITKEHKQYGDILQLNTPEQYRNLPVKILSAFQWVVDSVRDVKLVIKSDDDVYLYLPNVLTVTVRNDVIVGAYNPHSLVSRNSQDDWGVTKENYLPSYFPPYVSGGSYLMSVVVSRRILQSLITCRTLHIEDVFITGILAISAGVTHQSHTGFSFWTTPKAQACDFIKGRVNSVNMSVKKIYNLHRYMTSNQTCTVK